MLAEVLWEGGYNTVGIFTNPHHHSTSVFWQGFEVAAYLKRKGGLSYSPAATVHGAFFDWLDTQDSSEPFFAYLHFMDPHAPYRPPPFLHSEFVTSKGTDRLRSFLVEGGVAPSEADLEYMVQLYDASIRFVDLVIEQVVLGLRERDRWGGVVLILTSDHGEEFMDHGSLGHGGTLDREMLLVPMILHDAREDFERSRGRRVPDLIRNIDLAPTIVELAGLPVPSDFEGTSLARSLCFDEEGPHWPQTSFAAIGQLRSLTTQDWHFIHNLRTGGQSLYDLSVDPMGLHNVVAREEETAVELTAKLAEFETARLRVAERALRIETNSEKRGEATDPDPEILEQLKALGYVD